MSNVKISINDSPTDQVLASSVKEEVVSDAAGRTIKLRKPGVLAQFRLVEAIGDSAMNKAYMNMVLPLLFVAEIDGEEVEPMSKKSHVEALISRLGEEGITAVVRGVADVFGAADPETEKVAIKKSQQPVP